MLKDGTAPMAPQVKDKFGDKVGAEDEPMRHDADWQWFGMLIAAGTLMFFVWRGWLDGTAPDPQPPALAQSPSVVSTVIASTPFEAAPHPVATLASAALSSATHDAASSSFDVISRPLQSVSRPSVPEVDVDACNPASAAVAAAIQQVANEPIVLLTQGANATALVAEGTRGAGSRPPNGNPFAGVKPPRLADARTGQRAVERPSAPRTLAGGRIVVLAPIDKGGDTALASSSAKRSAKGSAKRPAKASDQQPPNDSAIAQLFDRIAAIWQPDPSSSETKAGLARTARR